MNTAILGATGLVGRTVLSLIYKRNLGDNNITLFASNNSAGKIIKAGGKSHVVYDLASINDNYDLAFVCTESEISKIYSPKLAASGCFVIDNSSAFRRHVDVPLVVPQINSNLINDSTKIIANPNCSTIAMVLPIYNLQKLASIKRVVVSTYQAVSGAGKAGKYALKNGTPLTACHPIKNNVLALIGDLLSNKNTFEEDKMIFETKKILNSNFGISATCVRVPIENVHSESINIEFGSSISLKPFYNVLKAGGLKVLKNKLATPLMANNKNEIYISRIRKDNSTKNAINMFVCMDNLLKGAALNAIEIAEYLIASELINKK